MESLALKRLFRDKLGEARISIILGIIYNELTDLSKALEYPPECSEIERINRR